MDSKDKFVNIKEKEMLSIQDKRRGDLLYYSVSQVATLLNEEESEIRYYTNIFDDILKIEIVNKQLRYNNNDVDRLEFLIKLKNKGMTIKEIQEYCSELPLDEDNGVKIPENNSTSIEEMIKIMCEAQSKELEQFKNDLAKEIIENNSLEIKNMAKSIIDNQTKEIKELKDNVLCEVKEYIDVKFNEQSQKNEEIHEKIFEDTEGMLTDILERNMVKIRGTFTSKFEEFAKASVSRDESLINEIKKFEDVIKRAYCIQQEVEMQQSNSGFFRKIIGH